MLIIKLNRKMLNSRRKLHIVTHAFALAYIRRQTVY